MRVGHGGRLRWTVVLAEFGLICSTLLGQEKGAWRPVGTAAIYTTGFVVFSDGKISIRGKPFPITQTKQLTHGEISAIFRLDLPFTGSGSLYRVRIPKSEIFSHKNTLCNKEETEWVATYVEGDNLDLTFFSGLEIPDLSEGAMQTPSNVCGMFSFARSIASPAR